MDVHGAVVMHIHGGPSRTDTAAPVIAFAAIAPHGDIDVVLELREAMVELGRRMDVARVETAVVLTPHNVHVEGHFSVVVAGAVGRFATDRALAARILGAMREDGLPALGVSFGGNDPAEAEMPLDWGTEIPFEFMHAERTVVVCPARDRPFSEHVCAGAAIARATADERVALIASADHGHAHDPDGPYGFDPAATLYDARVQEILRSGRLDFEPLGELVDAAKADSVWQLLVLQGAVGEDAHVDQLAYAAPTYYGMLCAEVEPST
jgi:aromatic ring-opening dioxygenase LigB subunit